MGFERFIFDEEYLKEIETTKGNQGAVPVASEMTPPAPFIPVRPPEGERTDFHSMSWRTALLKLSLLLTPLLAYLGYHYYFQTEASTTINTTITENDDLSNGLVGHWTFDGPDMDWSSTTAELRDRSGNGNHLDATNINKSDVSAGRIGQSFNFDDVDDYFIRTNVSSALGVSTTASFAAWFKLTSSSTSKYNPILNKGDGNSVYDYDIYLDAGQIGIWSYSSGKFSTRIITDTDWHHVLVTRSSGGVVTFYIDGVLDSSSGGYTILSATSSRFTIGSDGPTYGTRSMFGGKIDDVRIYNRTLSASEAERLYQLGATTHINTTIDTNDDLENGLVGHWTFDGPDMNWSSSTAEILDTSGNNLNGDATTSLNQRSVLPGRIGQGLDFHGSSTIDLGNSSTLAPGAISIFGWYKEKKYSATSTMTFISKKGGIPYYLLTVGYTPVGGIFQPTPTISTSYAVSASSSTLSGSGCSLPVDGGWHFIGLSYNSSEGVVVYCDSTRIVTQAPAGSLNTGGASLHTLVGSDNVLSTTYMDGLLDDIRIYNRALSASEAKRLYELGATTHINTTIDTNDDLENGLVGHWTFDGPKMAWASSTAEVLDSSASSLEGDMVNMTTSAATAGKIGQGMRFNSSSSYIQVPASSAINDLGPVTMSAWIYPISAGGSGQGKIVAKNGTSPVISGQMDFIVRTAAAAGTSCSNTASNALAFFKLNTSAGAYANKCSVDNTIVLKTWQHVVVTWDGSAGSSGVKMYRNGAEVSYASTIATSGTVGSDATYALLIGNGASANREFDGSIDDVRIYNRVLSASEVKRLYDLGVGH